MDKYKILIIGVVYNDEHKFLVASRSKSEKFMPGVYSYHVGEMHFNANEKYEALEKSIRMEVEEEAGIQIKNPVYLSSHQYEENGTKVVAIAFLSKYEKGEIKSDSKEVESVNWMTIEEIRALDTLPVVHEVYEAAYNSLQTKIKLHYLSVGGLVINEKGEFMLVPDKTSGPDQNYLTFPIGDVVNLAGSTWEMLATNLANNLKVSWGVEIKDGAIPFTDQSFHASDDYAGIVEFFIARCDRAKEQSNSEVVWKKFNEIEQDKMRASVYKIFDKAAFFINELSNVKP